jgi:hypothetical protein
MTRAQMNNFFNNMSAINRFSASDLSIRLNSPPPCHFRVIDATLVNKISTVKKDTPEINIASSVINEHVFKINTLNHTEVYFTCKKVYLNNRIMVYQVSMKRLYHGFKLIPGDQSM